MAEGREYMVEDVAKEKNKNMMEDTVERKKYIAERRVYGGR